jgi:glycosyltransferase involved in cell wall biosynthesis
LAVASQRLQRNDPQSDGSAQFAPRILHVATRYLRGGSERRLRDIVLAIPEAQHHVVIGPDSDVDLAEREVAAARITVLPTLVRDPAPRQDLAALRTLRRLIEREAYDLVVSHQSKAGVLARAAVKKSAVPVVHSLSMANFGPGYSWMQSALFRRIETRLIRRTSAYVVVGSDLARRYAEIGTPPEKLHVVRSGVTIAERAERAAARAEICAALDLPADRPLVVYLGSLDQRKNVLDLPRLLPETFATGAPRPYLVVAGDGPLEGALRETIRAAGLEGDARLVGFVREPGNLLRAADVVVLLSSAEGVPQVLVQAAAAQTPFVAYAVDGVRELMELGAEGVAVPLGNVQAAAAATRALLARGRTVPHSDIDFSAWSPDAIRAGYRRVIGDALRQTTTDIHPLIEAVTS